MKICLLIPPASTLEKIPERVYGCTYSIYKQPELPLLYVGAILEREGHIIELQDFSSDHDGKSFQDFVHRQTCDLYILHTVLLAQTIDILAGRFILANSEARIIYFGPHPTLKPEEFLWDDRCFVVRGEAELTIRDLVAALPDKRFSAIKGISYLADGRLIENETSGIISDIDSLPMPARHLLKDRQDYFNPKLSERPVSLVLTSRGCRFRCYYCVPNSISWARELEWRRFHDNKKPPVTLRSPANIAEEFRIIKQSGYRAAAIVDDMFLFGGKKRILDLCGRLEGVGLPFGGLARCDLILDEEVVAALARAGCRYMDLGIESLDQGILKDIRKDLDVAKVRQAIQLLHQHGIEPKANIMFGASPLETQETINSTINEISSYPINYCMFLIATPFPGTEFSQKALAKGWALEPEIHDLEKNLSPTEKSLIAYQHLPKEELEKAVKKANRRFYLHPSRILYQLKKIDSFAALKNLIVTGWHVIK
ncbi:MAG: B12-binding domain-containing radical SAM protein [Proteobacteria bacterium]|nr:B12-binding domain-containing radical SAM protein [Pseudomonadota bacterium]MBU1738253.1 B12-binding domain-containing radical SAM protein [Pseudomonadota bacterium]